MHASLHPLPPQEKVRDWKERFGRLGVTCSELTGGCWAAGAEAGGGREVGGAGGCWPRRPGLAAWHARCPPTSAAVQATRTVRGWRGWMLPTSSPPPLRSLTL